MISTRQLLRNRMFLLSAGGVFLFQLGVLLLTTPLYDIDTNSFIRGGLSWDVYHNPFENLFIAAAGKIWSNATFIVMWHSLFYSFAAVLLAFVVFENPRWRMAAVAMAALEPATLFYNFSFLPESFYTSFTLLYCALLIQWMRQPTMVRAAFFGLLLGLAFMCKLSATVQLALLGFFVIQQGLAWRERAKHLTAAVVPFVACYAFVMVGQKMINEGELFTVAGRVRWDFSSSQYRPGEISAPDFERFVHPYIVKDGKVEPFRELRRELSYLGYKDCIAAFEAKGLSENRGIACCDSIFDVVGSHLIRNHLWAAEWQFVKDNLWCIHHLNYLDYRFTPGLPYYHPQKEYDYIDSLMAVHYGINLAERGHKLLPVWRSLAFGNVYMPLVWWLMVGGIVAAAFHFRRSDARARVALAATVLIPLVFHIVYISYRPRFMAPFFVAGLMLAMATAAALLSKKTSK